MNIFLVEDEHWALAELVELFKKYEPDHRVFAFDNGDDALSAVGNNHPHLVLTDINMPGIDGLELIEQLNRLDPTIMSMIVSVHDQFEYARTGMKFGVVDYLLKPVKKEVLFNAVDRAIQHIEIDSKRREEWMNGSISQMLLTAGIPQYEALRAVNRRAYCMVLLILEKGRALEGWKDTHVRIDDLKNQFASKSSQEGEVHCIDLDCWQRVILIPIAEAAQVGGVKGNLSLLYQQLKSFPTPFHLGYAVKSETNSLYETFSELKQRMDEHMKFGMATFLAPEIKNQDIEIVSVWEKVRVMEAHFKKGDILKGQEALQQILGDLRQKQITKRQLRLVIHDMLFSLKYNLLASKTGTVNINDLQEDIRVLDRLSGYGELFEWMNDKIISLYCGQEPKDMNPKGLVPVLLQLIHKNYQGNISLQQFAIDHHVSLGYLSRMFKSQIGYTFSEYMANYRIRKAQELLIGGVERVQEVSNLVGYEDLKHFNALFKKKVGETPITYARRNASNRKNPPHK